METTGWWLDLLDITAVDYLNLLLPMLHTYGFHQ